MLNIYCVALKEYICASEQIPIDAVTSCETKINERAPLYLLYMNVTRRVNSSGVMIQCYQHSLVVSMSSAATETNF